MALIAALLLAVLGLLPIANWIPGGHAAPWFAERLRMWLSGGAIVVGVAAIVGIAVRRYPARWPAGIWNRIAMQWRIANRGVDIAIAALATILYAVVARVILSARPLHIDEIIQVVQARIFASGRLWAPAPAYPEFTSSLHLLDWSGKVYGQFPAGGPAMLAVGTLLHAEWLVGPVAAGLGIYAFARLLRVIELRDGVALAALLLFAGAPFAVFLNGSMMNHVTTATWLLVAALALAYATRSADAAPRAAHAVPRAAFLAGLSFGIAASIRPLDAGSFAIPAAGWLLLRALRGGAPHIRALLWSGVGVAIPVVALLAVNTAQSGHPFEFGYLTMWGKSVGLGFHDTPWGLPHTPVRGLELINLYLLRLQSYFLETPVPSLLFATAALALTRTLSVFDRYVLLGSGLLLLSYFAYWHDGFYLGPRFLLPLAPWLALWTARLPAALAERRFPLPVQRAVLAGGMTALGISAMWLVPLRAAQYRSAMQSTRFDVEVLAQQAGVRGALVFVRESWGAQLMVRMWALGVSRTEAEQIYRTTDACLLDGTLAAVEQSGGDGAELARRVAPFRADSLQLVGLRVSPDTTPRIRAGSTITGRCVRRIIEDRNGFTIFAPLLLARGGDNLYRRDLHARDSLMITAESGRPLFLLTKDTLPTSVPRFVPISLDSMRLAWQADQGDPP